MERDIDLLKIVSDYLISHGYPEDSIFIEWKITDRHRVDMAVIDNKSKKPVAFFEFKRQRTRQIENMAIEQLKRYAQAIGDKSIPCYVVFGIPAAPYFEIYFLTTVDDKEELKLVPQIPSFTNIKNSLMSRAIIKIRGDKKTAFNWFLIVCWSLAVIVGFLLYLDFIKGIEITAERLGIFAIIVGLIVVPFAKKLSILGLEFERLQKEEKEEK